MKANQIFTLNGYTIKTTIAGKSFLIGEIINGGSYNWYNFEKGDELYDANGEPRHEIAAINHRKKTVTII